MKWKLFPSPFLASLEGQKTLSSVWKPCLSDPFSKDLIPCMENPVQLKGPQPDDIMSERYMIHKCTVIIKYIDLVMMFYQYQL